MCRIASLFLLQRLKGSILGNGRDFNDMDKRAVIKSLFILQGKAPREIQAILIETLGENAPSYATVTNWVASVNLVIFPPVMSLVLDDPKQ